MSFSISGSCKTSGAVAIPGATVSAVSYPGGVASGSAVTDSSGNYTISSLAAGDYVLTATLAGWVFQALLATGSGPSAQAGYSSLGVVITTANATGQNFQGTQLHFQFAFGGTSGSSVASITTAAFVASINGKLIVMVRGSAAPTSVTLTNGNSVSLDTSFTEAGGLTCALYSGTVAVNGSTTATANFSPNQTFATIMVWQVDFFGSAPFPGTFGLMGKDSVTKASGTFIDSNTINTLAPYAFVCAAENANANGTASSGRGLLNSGLDTSGSTFGRNAGHGLVYGATSSTVGMNLSVSGTTISMAAAIYGWLSNGIRGNCGVGNATVSYSGPRSGSVTADSAGNYFIPFINGADVATWTITPTATGVTFSPTSNTVAVSTLSPNDTTGPTFTGSTTITSAVTPTVTDTTITLAWTTAGLSNSKAFATGDIWTDKAALDNTIPAGETSHLAIITGLKPSTTYTVRVQSLDAVSGNISVTTAPAKPRVALTGMTLGSSVNSATQSDTHFTFKADDGNEYFTNCDGPGLSGASAGNINLSILTNPATVAGTVVNNFSGYGTQNTYNGNDDPVNPGSTSTNKWGSAVFSIAGKLFGIPLRQNANPQFYQYRGSICFSPDHGVNWGNWQNPGVVAATGIRPSPEFGYAFGDSRIGWAGVTRYAADDGTLGYNTAGNGIDGGNGWMYHFLFDQQGNFTPTLMRIPRRALVNLTTPSYASTPYAVTPQFWIGPSSPTPQDFVNDSNWSNTFSGTTQIYPFGEWGHITFVPVLNSYVLSTFITGKWKFATGPTPAGPFTTFYDVTPPNPNGQGGLPGPCPLHSDVSANALFQNLTFRVQGSGAFGTPNYHPYIFAATWTTNAYNITGSVGAVGGGATIAYSGTASGSVTADALGNYIIPGLANGSYTVTPSKSGASFSPANQSTSISSANQTSINFTSSQVGGSVFFCESSNQWVTGGCAATKPTPNPPTHYPAFDPLINTWINSGNYGEGTPAKFPYFSPSQNQWITS